MNYELETLKSAGFSGKIVAKLQRYLNTENPAIPLSCQDLTDLSDTPWAYEDVGAALVSKCDWNDTARAIFRFFILLPVQKQGVQGKHPLLGLMKKLNEPTEPAPLDFVIEVLAEIRAYHADLQTLALRYLQCCSQGHDFALSPEGTPDGPYLSPITNFVFEQICELDSMAFKPISSHPKLFEALAIYRPEFTTSWCKATPFPNFGFFPHEAWKSIVRTSNKYDDLCLEYAERLCKNAPGDAFRILEELDTLRNGAYRENLLEIAAHPDVALSFTPFRMLLESRWDRLVPILLRAFSEAGMASYQVWIDESGFEQVHRKIREEWDRDGARLLAVMTRRLGQNALGTMLNTACSTLNPTETTVLRAAFLERVEETDSREAIELWSLIAAQCAGMFLSEFEDLLCGKSKPLRELAAKVLADQVGTAFADHARQWLSSSQIEARAGAVEFLTRLADPTSIPHLESAHAAEKTQLVRDALHQALLAHGKPPVINLDPSEILASAIIQAKKLKVPNNSWLNPEKLTGLYFAGGEPLSGEIVRFLLAKQAKHKEIAAAPDIQPLLAHIDHQKSGSFAIALVEGFLASEQAAADRWALALSGLLGDKRIITLLLPRIHDWCENSRHKLAEYAAQAIALLPGNEPLMVLDTLANRYRSKFKNVGKACADAFNAAAVARGITSDELGDLVVPTFDFDADGIRRFEWNGGGASAELAADFKLAWFDPETEKSWKSLPSSAPAEIKDEVKTLGKLLREAVKGQTARHEIALVRQRRWPVARWRELYENHPLLRSFAGGLVWGVYDASGGLLRTFRRYPNGILADASGNIEELSETDTVIGMIHPLELQAVAIDAWKAHFSRLKVKDPFPQLDRPVELMDPLHGNRRKVSITADRKLGAGTFKSRSEKRGWLRGSVVDAGGISSVYKSFPGAGIEAILMTNNYWIGIDPMDEVELGAAYFVKADTVSRGSYTYDEPDAEDPRVLRFDQVPAVVYSETLGDLKAIIATKE